MDSSTDSAEALKYRIQKETQRVRRRLTNDSEPFQETAVTTTNNHNNSNSRQPKPPPLQQPQPPRTVQYHNNNNNTAADSVPYIVENTSTHIDDPVPVTNMSAHLKNEHEAFKQR